MRLRPFAAAKARASETMEGRRRFGWLGPPHLPSSTPPSIKRADPEADAVEDELLAKVCVGCDDGLASTLGQPVNRTQPVFQPQDDVGVGAEFEAVKLDPRSKYSLAVLSYPFEILLLRVADLGHLHRDVDGKPRDNSYRELRLDGASADDLLSSREAAARSGL